MREVAISANQVTLVDDADFDLVNGFSWHFRPSASTIGNGYACGIVGGKSIYLHRFIMAAPPHLQVDHINHNSLDNQRSNLRLANMSEQNINRRSTRTPISGFRGVAFHSGYPRPYRANCGAYGVRYNGPYRLTAEEAARDYDAYMLSRAPEFAILNFPIPSKVEANA